MSSRVLEELMSEIDQIRLIDTHEHLPDEAERIARKVDALSELFLHYASSDAVASGLSLKDLARIRDVNEPLENRWRLLEPYWLNFKNTGYARAILLAIRDIYGFEELTGNTVLPLSLKMQEMNRPGLYELVLKEKSGVDLSIRDAGAFRGAKTPYFVDVYRFDDFITASSLEELEALERKANMSIHSLRQLEGALESHFEKAFKGGIVGVKTGLAYVRPILYEKATYHEAEVAFNSLFRRYTRPGWGRNEGHSFVEMKPLQDYMMHRVLQLAEGYGLPVQVHTGLQEGYGNTVANSDPKLLVNLFIEYRKIKFDIFHSGYPYLSDLAALAKNFANVYADMCWMNIISPTAARRVLSEYLDTVPASKIFAFGGDYCFVEGVYGHQLIARWNVARVLAEKVEEGYFGIGEAKRIAWMILRENPLEVFGLEERVER